MFKFSKFLIAGAGLAALAGAAPSTAQYYGYSSPYNNGYSQYNNGYSSYGYAPMVNTSLATQQCTAAVNKRLYTRRGLGGIIGPLIRAYATKPQGLSVNPG